MNKMWKNTSMPGSYNSGNPASYIGIMLAKMFVEIHKIKVTYIYPWHNYRAGSTDLYFTSLAFVCVPVWGWNWWRWCCHQTSWVGSSWNKSLDSPVWKKTTTKNMISADFICDTSLLYLFVCAMWVSQGKVTFMLIRFRHRDLFLLRDLNSYENEIKFISSSLNVWMPQQNTSNVAYIVCFA